MAQIQILTHFSIVWLHVAVDHRNEAASAHERVRAADPIEGVAQMTAATEEMQASMVGISAAAHAVDAFYGYVQPHISIPTEMRHTWRENRTPRRAIILETLKRGFDVGAAAVAWADDLRWLYDRRDASVHHSPEWQEQEVHPTIPGYRQTPEWLGYSADTTTRAVQIAGNVLEVCADAPRAEFADLVHACRGLGESFRLEMARVAP